MKTSSDFPTYGQAEVVHVVVDTGVVPTVRAVRILITGACMHLTELVLVPLTCSIVYNGVLW